MSRSDLRAGPVRCTIAEACSITGVSLPVLRDRAARGQIPGASKPAGRWLFVIADLEQWAARGTREPTPRRSAPIARRVAAGTRAGGMAAYEDVLARR